MNAVPSLSIAENGSTIAEVQLRTDVGNLCIFAKILDSSYATTLSNTSNPGADFGTIPGIEIMLGPDGAGRSKAGPGDTRIFISFPYKKVTSNKFTANVYLIKPNSTAIP